MTAEKATQLSVEAPVRPIEDILRPEQIEELAEAGWAFVALSSIWTIGASASYRRADILGMKPQERSRFFTSIDGQLRLKLAQAIPPEAISQTEDDIPGRGGERMITKQLAVILMPTEEGKK